MKKTGTKPKFKLQHFRFGPETLTESELLCILDSEEEMCQDNSNVEEEWAGTIAFEPQPSTSTEGNLQNFNDPEENDAPLIVDKELSNEESSSSDEELITDRNIDVARIETAHIEGRRIVDLNYFLQDIHEKFDNHCRGIECSFSHLTVVESRQRGLRTEIDMQCRMCNYKATVCSEAEDSSVLDINHSAVAGTLTTGNGYSQLEELLSSMNIPCMSKEKYQKCHANIVEGFKKAALDEMKVAGEAERALAIQRGDIKNGIAHIPVVADGSWMKRSYRTRKYDSPSGVGAIVGYHTRKILFIGVRNKYCTICENAAQKEREAKNHVCYKNWGRNQSSTSMESDAIVEGFKCSLEMHGLLYSTLIADGDSSVYKRILESDPYYDVRVKKIECTNHLLRNLAHKIKEISKTKGRIGKWQNVVENSVMRIRNAVVKAAEHRMKETSPIERKVAKLREDIANISSHVFGEHKNCALLGYFCDGSLKEGEENVVPAVKEIGLYSRIQDTVNNLGCYAESLLYNMNSNSVESYNAIICKFIGGKRVNFAKRGSYEARCAGAVLQYNTQACFSKLSSAMAKESPDVIKRLEEKRKRKVERTAELKKDMKKKRYEAVRHNAPDESYGPNSERPDMEETLYEAQLKLHNTRLLEWQQQRNDIERQTTQQASSELWFSIRKKNIDCLPLW